MQAEMRSCLSKGNNLYDMFIVSNVSPNEWYSDNKDKVGEFQNKKIAFFSKWYNIRTKTLYCFDEENQEFI